jgi:hypothetical protein
MHDWTLIGVNFEWRSACASLELEDAGAKRRTLTVEQVRLLEVPRENEWGPSVSVNEASEEPGPDGIGRMLRIEMQSGDVIRVWGANVTMT